MDSLKNHGMVFLLHGKIHEKNWDNYRGRPKKMEQLQENDGANEGKSPINGGMNGKITYPDSCRSVEMCGRWRLSLDT